MVPTDVNSKAKTVDQTWRIESYRAMSSADGPVGIATKPPVESARQIRVEEECGDVVVVGAEGRSHMGFAIPFNTSTAINELMVFWPQCAINVVFSPLNPMQA